jgi:cytochrome c peroxidase
MIDEDRIIQALGNFIGSMVTFNSRFDIEADNGFAGFTDDELAGQELFTMNCATCHSGGEFFFGDDIPTEEIITIFPFIFNNGLEAVSSDLGAGDWLPGMDGLFKITSLRNIELTAPYMHDGSLETLSDVIDFYSDDVQSNEWSGFFIPEGGFGFTTAEKVQLKAFLLTLTDESFKTNPKWSDPFAPVSFVVEEELLDVQVSPNPMASFTKITIEDNDNSSAQLMITDQMGKQVFTDTFNGNTYNFNNYILPTGIYNVVVQNEKGKNALQLVVQ